MAADASASGDGPAGESASGDGGAEIAELVKARLRDVPDYPQPRVVFKDITPLLADGPALAAVVTALSTGHDGGHKEAGIEARGFILAAPVAIHPGAPL